MQTAGSALTSSPAANSAPKLLPSVALVASSLWWLSRGGGAGARHSQQRKVGAAARTQHGERTTRTGGGAHAAGRAGDADRAGASGSAAGQHGRRRHSAQQQQQRWRWSQCVFVRLTRCQVCSASVVAVSSALRHRGRSAYPGCSHARDAAGQAEGAGGGEGARAGGMEGQRHRGEPAGRSVAQQGDGERGDNTARPPCSEAAAARAQPR
jgi:hypothetical protein